MMKAPHVCSKVASFPRRLAACNVICLATAVAAISPFTMSANGGETPGKPQAKRDEGKEFEMMLALARGHHQETADEEETKQNINEALTIYRQMIALGVSGKMRCEAWWGIGRCCFRLGSLWEAYEAIEQSFPPTFEPQAVAERVALEYQIALGFMAFGSQPAAGATVNGKSLTGYEAASRVFHAVVYNDRRAPEAAFALIGEGDCLAESGDWQAAQKVYRRFLREYPRHELAAEAKAALARALVANAGGCRPAIIEEAAALAREAEGTGETGERLRMRLAAYLRARQEAMAADLLSKADFYLRQKSAQGRKAGVFTLREVERQYPETKAAQQAAERLAALGESRPNLEASTSRQKRRSHEP